MKNTSHATLIAEISKFGTPTSDDITYIHAFFVSIQVKKNIVLEEQDKVPKHIYFIHSGFMRLFYTDISGAEQTTFLCAPNSFIAPFSAFINQTKSMENVETITNCDLLQLTHANALKLVEKSELFRNFFVTIFEKSMSLASIRANDLAFLHAEQRYQKLLEQQPHYIQNIPLVYIASYLGIKPQSLSRIRKQIIK